MTTFIRPWSETIGGLKGLKGGHCNPGRNFGKAVPSCHTNLFPFPVIFLYEFSLTDHQNGQMESGKPLSKRYLQAMEIWGRFRISIEKLADIQNSDRLGKIQCFCQRMPRNVTSLWRWSKWLHITNIFFRHLNCAAEKKAITSAFLWVSCHRLIFFIHIPPFYPDYTHPVS